jgi:hypothetical protein
MLDAASRNVKKEEMEAEVTEEVEEVKDGTGREED